tara:strand:+ start:529 stop:2073 length:1545 start_codon:yes stop_codon:yes gene_type:complete
MKLVLSESQYNRIFNNKKRKIVVTESQYNRLLNESDLSDGFTKIKKFDIIKIEMEGSEDSTLHFRVMYINSNEIIMINCNNGVYKNAYFYINKSGYSGDSLKYRIAQDKNIDIEVSDGKVSEKNLLDTLGDNKIWRDSTFNNISSIDIYVDGEQDCNLSDKAKKKLTIVDDGSKDDSKDDSKEDGGDNDGLKEVIELFKDVKPKNNYKITIGNYIANDKRNKGSNKATGSILINVTEVSSNNIFFEVLKTKGSGAKEYDDLLDKDLTFIKNSKNIKIKKDSKADFKMFDINLEVRDGKTSDDDGGSLTQKDDVIANIMNFEFIDADEDDEEVGLSKAEIKKAIEDDDILKDMIQKRPVKFMELMSSSIFRKKGIIPSQKIFDEWGANNRERNALLDLSEGDIIEFKFEGNAEPIGTRNEEELSKLEKFKSAVKNKGGEFKGKVGKYKPGGKYISILCKELDGVYYRLRLYENQSSGSDDIAEVIIAFYDTSGYSGGNEIAKDKIKIIKNKSKKK